MKKVKLIILATLIIFPCIVLAEMPSCEEELAVYQNRILELEGKINSIKNELQDGKTSLIESLNSKKDSGLTKDNTFEEIATAIGEQTIYVDNNQRLYPNDESGLVTSWLGSTNDTLYTSNYIDFTNIKSITFNGTISGYLTASGDNAWVDTATCQLVDESGKVIATGSKNSFGNSTQVSYTFTFGTMDITSKLRIQIIHGGNKRGTLTVSSIYISI